MLMDKAPIYGLILAGGKSTRMGKDKSTLCYHAKMQVEYAYDLLLTCCPKVFVSNRPDQSELTGHKDLPQLHDLPQYSGKGPLSGILSAMDRYPCVAWLVVACDLPFLTSKACADLIKERDPNKIATAFISVYDQLPEPLCAVWEPAAKKVVLDSFNKGVLCPRKVLIQTGAHLIKPHDPHWLDNVNDPEGSKQACDELNRRQRTP